MQEKWERQPAILSERRGQKYPKKWCLFIDQPVLVLGWNMYQKGHYKPGRLILPVHTVWLMHVNIISWERTFYLKPCNCTVCLCMMMTIPRHTHAYTCTQTSFFEKSQPWLITIILSWSITATIFQSHVCVCMHVCMCMAGGSSYTATVTDLMTTICTKAIHVEP